MPRSETASTRSVVLSLIAAVALPAVLWHAQAVTPAAALVVGAVLVGGVVVVRRRVREALDHAARSGLERDRAAAALVRAATDEAVAAAAALDALPDAIIELDGAQKVVRANAAAREGFGAAAGADITAVVRDPDVLASIEDALSGREAIAVSYTRPGPVVRHFQVVVLRPKLPAGARVGALMVLHEVTALRRASDLRVEFVANVSHELRTPLSVLLGFIETLRGPARDDPEGRERFLAIMQTEAQRMARLVSDLLSLSRIEASEHDPPTETAALAPIVARVVDALALPAREKLIQVAVEVAPDLPTVIGDADQLQQVFQNLLENAIKYGRAGGAVRVTGTHLSAAGRVAVTVEDEGEGIAREHLARLTERFYRVDSGRSRRLGGTGLGLAIVKHIVNRHRGTLAIESEVGRGSRFTVTLPIA